eukprot:TRINITY_DN4319_c0_g1_i12.p1 TRINITY_DN4319_c0_g1~~TRINITY_DN4319_c0_g1_i12.p1  ORF type:complete len:257 (-),score=71.71 TRINITY_DN4319_c0_g1_i12:95-844(-)
MIRRPPRSTHCISSAASDVYKRQVHGILYLEEMTEQFMKEYTKAKSNLTLIQNEMEMRKSEAVQGRSTVRSDNFIKAQLRQLSIQIRGLDQSFSQASKFGLSSKDSTKQKSLLRELRDGYERCNTAHADLLDDPNPMLMNKDDEETKVDDSPEFATETQRLIKMQDEVADALHGTLKGIKYAGNNINDQIQGDIDIINQSSQDMEKLSEKIKIVDGRLKTVIKKANACCLWTIIVLELVAIFVIVLWML